MQKREEKFPQNSTKLQENTLFDQNRVKFGLYFTRAPNIFTQPLVLRLYPIPGLIPQESLLEECRPQKKRLVQQQLLLWATAHPITAGMASSHDTLLSKVVGSL